MFSRKRLTQQLFKYRFCAQIASKCTVNWMVTVKMELSASYIDKLTRVRKKT